MTFRAPNYDQKLGYAALDDRQMLDMSVGIGVTQVASLNVSAGAGFASTVAPGQANVRGSFATGQGVYAINNVGSATAVHNTPDVTNPRIDQVYAKVYDSTDGGDLSDSVQPLIVTGTATGGATLDNRTGVGAVPTNALLLADVLVPAGAANAAAFTYRDRRPYAVNGLIPSARGTVAVDQVMMMPAGANAFGQTSPSTSSGVSVAVLAYLPRRIVGATVLRHTYRQASSTALTGNYAIAVFDASMRLIVSTGAVAFSGAIGVDVAKADAIATTTFEAGLYYMWYGVASLAGNTGTGSSQLGIVPNPTGFLGTALSPAGPAAPNSYLIAGGSTTTAPTTLLAYTDQFGSHGLDGVPACALATA